VDLGLNDPGSRSLRLAFGLSCAARVEHLLEDSQVRECLEALRRVMDGRADEPALIAASLEAARLANAHRGSNSIDGARHAAVSASYAVAAALAGNALEAAGYAAYATVYSYGGYAVSDRTAFEAEFAWQVDELRRLASIRRVRG
jgi:hypothetical protein